MQPGATNRQLGTLGPLTDNQGALGPLTDDQEVPEHLINNQGPLTNNQGALGPLTDNLGAPGPLTDDQRSRARDPLIQIFNNLYAKPVRNLRALS